MSDTPIHRNFRMSVLDPTRLIERVEELTRELHEMKRYWMTFTCMECHGSGWVYKDDLTTRTKPCPKCNGSGWKGGKQ